MGFVTRSMTNTSARYLSNKLTDSGSSVRASFFTEILKHGKDSLQNNCSLATTP